LPPLAQTSCYVTVGSCAKGNEKLFSNCGSTVSTLSLVFAGFQQQGNKKGDVTIQLLLESTINQLKSKCLDSWVGLMQKKEMMLKSPQINDGCS